MLNFYYHGCKSSGRSGHVDSRLSPISTRLLSPVLLSEILKNSPFPPFPFFFFLLHFNLTKFILFSIVRDQQRLNRAEDGPGSRASTGNRGKRTVRNNWRGSRPNSRWVYRTSSRKYFQIYFIFGYRRSCSFAIEKIFIYIYVYKSVCRVKLACI